MVELETILDWVDVVGLMKLNSIEPELRQVLSISVVVEAQKLAKQAIYKNLADLAECYRN